MKDLKRVFIALAFTMPVGQLLESLSDIAWHDEEHISLKILASIVGLCLFYWGWYFAGKIVNKN